MTRVPVHRLFEKAPYFERRSPGAREPRFGFGSLLADAFLQFERHLDLGLVFTLWLVEFDRLVLDGHAHEVIERLIGPIDRVVYGIFEAIVTPSDQGDFLENHPMDSLDHYRKRLTV